MARRKGIEPQDEMAELLAKPDPKVEAQAAVLEVDEEVQVRMKQPVQRRNGEAAHRSNLDYSRRRHRRLKALKLMYDFNISKNQERANNRRQGFTFGKDFIRPETGTSLVKRMVKRALANLESKGRI